MDIAVLESMSSTYDPPPPPLKRGEPFDLRSPPAPLEKGGAIRPGIPPPPPAELGGAIRPGIPPPPPLKRGEPEEDFLLNGGAFSKSPLLSFQSPPF
jgi:hypothetical protein